MKVHVVRIGNSRGIRIPKKILEECRIEDSVDLAVKGGRLVLTPVKGTPRVGWLEAAERMSRAGDDSLLVPDVLGDDEDLHW
jgi:antitoxin MazE